MDIANDLLDIANDHGIKMLSLPPHCSHRLQPLDVVVFGHFKTMYRHEVTAWMKHHIGRKFELHHVPSIAEQCLDKVATRTAIKNGFLATRICSFSRNRFEDADFAAADFNDEENEGVNPRLLMADDEIETAAHEEISTSGILSEASTSEMGSIASIRSALKNASPLGFAEPAKKSNFTRKYGNSTSKIHQETK